MTFRVKAKTTNNSFSLGTSWNANSLANLPLASDLSNVQPGNVLMWRSSMDI